MRVFFLKCKPIKIFLILLLIIIIAVFSVTQPKNALATNAKSNNTITVIVDAGHGGFDGGAVANDGTVEKDINLSIALKLGEMLDIMGYNVVFTRTVDNGTDNLETGSIASRKKADLKNRLELMYGFSDAMFVSIHLNKFTSGSAKGAQVFYSPNYEQSKELGTIIQSSVKNLVQPENSRVCKKAGKDIYLLYNSPLPAVIVECGFLSNSLELKLLKDEDYQTSMAFSILCGILEYYSS